jgi:hypothetical protein
MANSTVARGKPMVQATYIFQRSAGIIGNSRFFPANESIMIHRANVESNPYPLSIRFREFQ